VFPYISGCIRLQNKANSHLDSPLRSSGYGKPEERKKTKRKEGKNKLTNKQMKKKRQNKKRRHAHCNKPLIRPSTPKPVSPSYSKIGLEYRSRYSDSLRTRRSGDRFSLKQRFPAPVKIGPGAHPSSCKMGTASLSRG